MNRKRPEIILAFKNFTPKFSNAALGCKLPLYDR